MSIRNKAHEALKDDLLFHFGSRPDVRVWVRDVGFDEKRKMSFGIPGECDIDGIVAPWGIRIGIEVKTGSGTLSAGQRRWRDMLVKFGGIHIEARSLEQAKSEFQIKLRERLDEITRLLAE